MPQPTHASLDTARLKPCANWMSLPGCLVRATEYLGVDADAPWVFGGSGIAFALNVHEQLCPSGPTAWRDHHAYPLLANLGLKVRSAMAWNHHDNFASEQAKVLALAREALAAGKPVIAWDMKVPEWYVLSGYEGDDLMFLDYGGAVGWLPAGKLGDTNTGFAAALAIEKGPQAGLETVLRDVVAFAQANAQGKHRAAPAYHCGIDGYDTWMAALKGVATAGTNANFGFGAAYNAACWSECRRMAAEFLSQAARRTSDGELAAALKAAADRYQAVAENLTTVAKLMPFDVADAKGMESRWRDPEVRAKAVEKLAAARAAEAQALETLKQVLAVLDRPRPV